MDRRMNHKRTIQRFATIAAVTIAVLGIMGLGDSYAQGLGGAGAENKAEDKQIVVGIYQPQRAFQQFPGRAKLIEAYQSSQEDMAKAREDGDQQKSQQLQQELQQKQQQVIEEFESAVEEALPDIARKAGLKLVATDVVFSADDVGTKDITPQIIEAIGGKAESNARPQPGSGRR